MFFGTITMLILYLILKYILSWITYFNNLDPRLGDSTWRWSYDYHVIGERDISDLDDKDFYKKGKDKLIRNYGIGAQIIKDLKIKNMTLITKSPKKVIGLDGYGIKITKQEIIK